MSYKIKPVENSKLLSLICLLSDYDLFHISVSDGREFNATEIVEDTTGYLRFKRSFATSMYSKGYIIDIKALSETIFICQTQYLTYKIISLHKKPENSIIRKQKNWEEISDLMDISYLGEQFTSYDQKEDKLILVVDPFLLGELHPMEQLQIRHIINVYLDGYSNSMQMSRTVCFQILLHDEQNRIYAGMYDLEHQIPKTSILLYDNQSQNIISKKLYISSKIMLEYAKTYEKNSVSPS